LHVAKKCGVSLGAVNKIMKQKETESVDAQRKEQCGRKIKTTPRDEAFYLRGSKFHPRKTSYDLHQDLEKDGIYGTQTILRWREKNRETAEETTSDRAYDEKLMKWKKLRSLECMREKFYFLIT
ncbi:hypothetical protein J6590_072293, partial [Homalodisca vitripennis]